MTAPKLLIMWYRRLLLRRLAVVGLDSCVGAAAMVHFDGTAEVTGVRFAEQVAVADLCTDCTDIIVCGDASLSSWDDSFGDLRRDHRLVPEYCRLAEKTGVRLVYISSDAVFGSPWVFHDDDCSRFSDSVISRQLRSIEHIVLRSPQNLVIRTNAISDMKGFWLDHLRRSFRDQIPVRMSANQYATPLADCRLALLMDHVLQTSAAGILHLAGAERLSRWKLATQLAQEESVTAPVVLPSVKQAVVEQSLRCTRARTEFQLSMPTLSQTISDLTARTGSGSQQAA